MCNACEKENCLFYYIFDSCYASNLAYYIASLKSHNIKIYIQYTYYTYIHA